MLPSFDYVYQYPFISTYLDTHTDVPFVQPHTEKSAYLLCTLVWVEPTCHGFELILEFKVHEGKNFTFPCFPPT